MIRGIVATIEWGYYRAAAVNGYEIVHDKETGVTWATGVLVIADALKCSQRPLTFVAPTKLGTWRWPILDPVPGQPGPFAIRLGKQERTVHVVPSRQA